MTIERQDRLFVKWRWELGLVFLLLIGATLSHGVSIYLNQPLVGRVTTAVQVICAAGIFFLLVRFREIESLLRWTFLLKIAGCLTIGWNMDTVLGTENLAINIPAIIALVVIALLAGWKFKAKP